MENPYIIKRADDTPEIYLDYEKQEMKITGPSFPENSFEFYNQVLVWIDENTDKLDRLVCSFDYLILSSASNKMLFEIMIKLLDLSKAGKDISIKWYYAKYDEDMYREGFGFKKHLTIPVELIEK